MAKFVARREEKQILPCAQDDMPFRSRLAGEESAFGCG
jgi:hypothetical protein